MSLPDALTLVGLIALPVLPPVAVLVAAIGTIMLAFGLGGVRIGVVVGLGIAAACGVGTVAALAEWEAAEVCREVGPGPCHSISIVAFYAPLTGPLIGALALGATIYGAALRGRGRRRALPIGRRPRRGHGPIDLT